MNAFKHALKISRLGLVLASGQALAHGNVTPTVGGYQESGKLVMNGFDTNPYRDPPSNDLWQVKIGAFRYNPETALRCHGLEAIPAVK